MADDVDIRLQRHLADSRYSVRSQVITFYYAIQTHKSCYKLIERTFMAPDLFNAAPARIVAELPDNIGEKIFCFVKDGLEVVLPGRSCLSSRLQ